MISVEAFYNALKDFVPLQDQVFCDLHKCGDSSLCKVHQRHPMIHFDAVKDKFCKEESISPYSSTDGVTYNHNGILFFIEAKSWKLFEKYHQPDCEEKVYAQVTGYDFNEKLRGSIAVCKGVASKSNATISLPVVYVVVTDAGADMDGAYSLDAMLLYLAESSSDLSAVYGKAIFEQLSGITDVDNQYVDNCQELDAVLDSWKSARIVQIL